MSVPGWFGIKESGGCLYCTDRLTVRLSYAIMCVISPYNTEPHWVAVLACIK